MWFTPKDFGNSDLDAYVYLLHYSEASTVFEICVKHAVVLTIL